MSADLGLPPEPRDGVVGMDKELTLRCAGDPALEDRMVSGHKCKVVARLPGKVRLTVVWLNAVGNGIVAW